MAEKGLIMSKSKMFKIADFIVFAGIIAITAWSLSDKTVATKIDSKILPEERNSGFYEVLDSDSEVEGGDSEGEPYFYIFSFSKDALDGDKVTADDWKLLSNKIRYQMQADTAVMDFQDGTGIVVEKSEYPTGTYGTLQGTEIEGNGEIINDVSDYSTVMAVVAED